MQLTLYYGEGLDIDLNNTEEVPGIRLRRGWSPRVCRPQSRPFGHLYPDVVEVLPLRATGTTEANTRALIAEIVEALDWIRVWRDGGDEGDPVQLDCVPSGSSNTSVYVGIVDVAGNPDSLLNLPVNHFFKGQVAIDFDLHLVRRGAWLGGGEQPDPSAAAANPALMSITFSDDQTLPGPTDLSILDFTTAPMVPGYLLVARDPDEIHFQEAEDVGDTTTAGTWGAVGAAAALASGLEVGRWSAAGTDWQSVAYTSALTGRSVMIFAAIRLHDSDRTWQVKAWSRGLAGPGFVNSETLPVTLAYNGGLPQIVPLGTVVSAVRRHDSIRIAFRVDDPTGAPQIDFDYFVALVADGPTNRAIHIIPQAGLSGTFQFECEHRLLSAMTPQVRYTDTLGSLPLGYDSPPIVYSTGTNLSVRWLATAGAFWRHVNNNEDTVLSLRASAFRRDVYLVPE